MKTWFNKIELLSDPRQEVIIDYGEKTHIHLIKTDEGLVIDVYNRDDCIETMCIFDFDLI